MKNKLLIILISFLCMNLIMLQMPKVSATDISLANFDNNNAGTTSGSGTYYTYNTVYGGTVFTISNTVSVSPSNSLKILIAGAVNCGWLNFTSFDYMSEFSFWLYNFNNQDNVDILCYNSTHIGETTSKLNLMLHLNLYDNYIRWIDSEGNVVAIAKTYTANQWYKIVIKHISLNNINISYYNSTNVFQGGLDDTCTTIFNWTSIKDMLFVTTVTASVMYFDDFSCDTSGQPSGEGEEYEGEYENLEHKCFYLDNYNSEGLNFEPIKQYLGIEYKTKMNIVIKSFQMHVSTKYPNVGNIDLTGFTLRDKYYNNYGNPNDCEIYHEWNGEDNYIIRDYIIKWNDINFVVYDEYPVFFVKSTKKQWYSSDGSNYYYWAYSTTYYDDWREIGTAFSIRNWNFNVDDNGHIGGTSSQIDLSNVIPFCFYYETSSIPTISPYDFDLITVPEGTLYTNTSIKICYFVKTLANQNAITISKDGNLLYTKNIYSYTGIIDYPFLNSGNYVLNLSRTGEGVVDTITISLVDILVDSWIYCTPEPSNIGQTYYIYYKYQNPSGYDGAIFCYEYDRKFFNIGRYEDVTPTLLKVIDSNTSGVISRIGNTDGANYIILATYTNISCELFSYLHYIQIENMQESISVAHSLLVLGDLGYANQSLSWKHYHYGYEIKIYDNDNFIVDCGNKLQGSANYRVIKIGKHNVTLYMITSNGLISLANTSFNVIGYELITTPNVGNIGIDILGYISSLPIIIRYPFGIAITIIITVLPFIIMLYVSRHSNLTEIKLPSTIYLGLFIFGEVIAVTFRFFDWYIIAITFFAIVLGFVIDWLRKNSSSGE